MYVINLVHGATKCGYSNAVYTAGGAEPRMWTTMTQNLNTQYEKSPYHKGYGACATIKKPFCCATSGSFPGHPVGYCQVQY